VSLLTVVLVLAMLLWAMGFVVSGLVLAEEALWRRPAGPGLPPISRTRRLGAVVLLVLGGILVVTAIVTGLLVAERESRLVHLEDSVSQLERTVRALGNRLDLAPPAPPAPPAGTRGS
jgi:hypothetical protein